jgi:predicted solute-binding protein
MQADRLRFGYTPSIHLLPLLHPLLAGWVYPTGYRLDLVPLPPADLEPALAAGDLDGGLIHPLAYQRLRAGLEAMPGIGLASDGANSMVVLQSAARPDELDGATITVHPSAAGGLGHGLLERLAQPYFGITLNLTPPAPLLVAENKEADSRSSTDSTEGPDDSAQNSELDSALRTPHSALLLAGDAAVQARLPWLLYESRFSPSTLAAAERAEAKGRPVAPAPPAAAPDPAVQGYAEDLGAAWWVFSGTAMVWAVGVVRAALLDQPQAVVALVRALEASRAAARDQAATVLAAAAAQAGIPEAAVQTLFDRQRPDLDAAAQGGLAAFLRVKRKA